MPKLTLTLHENSKRFLVEAIRKAIAAETNGAEWQFAVLNLVQAIELSLKELLRRQHPVLIFKNIDDPKHTVTLEGAVTRLKHSAKIELDSVDYKAIKTASDLRNHIVHHEYSVDPEELKLVFAKLLGFLKEFSATRLATPLDTFIPVSDWRKGVAITAYGEELFARATKYFEDKGYSEEYIFPCPRCGWDAHCAWDGIDTCQVCHNKAHLMRCDRCGITESSDGESYENSSHTYCRDCIEYITNDYWYEQSVGK